MNRQLLRKLAELPKQHVTSLFSCIIFIISHMAVYVTITIQGKSHQNNCAIIVFLIFMNSLKFKKSIEILKTTLIQYILLNYKKKSIKWSQLNPVSSRRKMLHIFYSLSGVQSVKRGTSSGTLSMFFRWGRTWWIPRGSLACREKNSVT